MVRGRSRGEGGPDTKERYKLHFLNTSVLFQSTSLTSYIINPVSSNMLKKRSTEY